MELRIRAWFSSVAIGLRYRLQLRSTLNAPNIKRSWEIAKLILSVRVKFAPRDLAKSVFCAEVTSRTVI